MLARFNAIIQKSGAVGGWTYVVWPESAGFFGTRARVRVRAAANGERFESSFMPLGDGNHKLPLTGEMLKRIDRKAGQEVEILVLNRM